MFTLKLDNKEGQTKLSHALLKCNVIVPKQLKILCSRTIMRPYEAIFVSHCIRKNSFEGTTTNRNTQEREAGGDRKKEVQDSRRSLIGRISFDVII